MLVTFSSDRHDNITMFGDVAIQLIKMMGHSGEVPGAILAKDVSNALANLQNELLKTNSANYREIETEDDSDPPVSLGHRAIPLIDLMHTAIKAKSDVMWRKGT